MSREAPSDRSPIDVHDPRVVASIDRYWRANLRVMAVLLAIWAFVGLGCGVLLADTLNQTRLGGFPLGFWFAQQGSILTFVVLILVYALYLNRLDDRHHAELVRLESETAGPAADGSRADGDAIREGTDAAEADSPREDSR